MQKIQYSVLTTPDGQVFWVIPASEAIKNAETHSQTLTTGDGPSVGTEGIDIKPTDDSMGSYIRDLRIAAGFSQRRLGLIANVTQAEICRIERKQVQPQELTKQKLLNALTSSKGPSKGHKA